MLKDIQLLNNNYPYTNIVVQPEIITFDDKTNNFSLIFVEKLVYWDYLADDEILLLNNMFNPKFDRVKIIYNIENINQFLKEHLNQETYETVGQFLYKSINYREES